MEPVAAEKLVSAPLLKKCNAQIGMVVTDGDSLAINAARNVCDHEIAHQNDKNHTSKGLKSALYKLKATSKFKELSTPTITYLHRCFTYCISQNEGDSKSMAAAIKNIPYHCYNDDKECVSRCGFLKNPETYKHASIGDGFQNQQMFEALKSLFETLASKCDKYMSGLSSNPNENLNHMAATRAPKSRLYGTSTSNDFRFACTVLKKNEGESYITNLSKNLNLSPETHTKRLNNIVEQKAVRRAEYVQTPVAKRVRMAKKSARASLKFNNESSEGQSYESNIQLLANFDIKCHPIAKIDNSLVPKIVDFDLETCDFKNSADSILQIAACDSEQKSFSIYVRPKKIDAEASNVDKIVLNDGFLFHAGVKVSDVVSLSKAMQNLYDYLYQFKTKIILAAHNCAFDRGLFLKVVEKIGMTKYFESII